MSASSVDISAIKEAIAQQGYELAAKELAKALAKSLARECAREHFALLESGKTPVEYRGEHKTKRE